MDACEGVDWNLGGGSIGGAKEKQRLETYKKKKAKDAVAGGLDEDDTSDMEPD